MHVLQIVLTGEPRILKSYSCSGAHTWSMEYEFEYKYKKSFITSGPDLFYFIEELVVWSQINSKKYQGSLKKLKTLTAILC